MNFEQRLIAAAKFVYAGDSVADDPPVNSVDFGVEAALKPHQVEGVSWLVRRYLLGVNVILGIASFYKVIFTHKANETVLIICFCVNFLTSLQQGSRNLILTECDVYNYEESERNCK